MVGKCSVRASLVLVVAVSIAVATLIAGTVRTAMPYHLSPIQTAISEVVVGQAAAMREISETTAFDAHYVVNLNQSHHGCHRSTARRVKGAGTVWVKTDAALRSGHVVLEMVAIAPVTAGEQVFYHSAALRPD